ncbi:MAG TPA: hypothetical protein HPP97_03980 [Desulfuromonadales bacterium]|nr:hypothetical protein [Desulfuromonadales bacterium]
MKKYLLNVILSFALLTLAACGGGGSDIVVPPPAKTTATVKVSLSGTLGADTIAGASFILTLPANVTPAMTGGAVATSVVMPSGTFAGGTSVAPVPYTPAVGATPGKLEITVANSVPAGVTTVGEIVTITLQLANGAAPAAAAFPVSSVSVINTAPGAAIAGMSASVTSVTLQ